MLVIVYNGWKEVILMQGQIKKRHSVSCCNSLQSASFPDARHLYVYTYYATSVEAYSRIIKKREKQKGRHNYVKRKQETYWM